MNLNSHSHYSLQSGNIKPTQLLAIASENGCQTLALTAINSTSTCLDFVHLSSKYKIKPVLGMAIRYGAQQPFILIAKNKNGSENINDYLSGYLQDPELQIPEIVPKLKDVFVIYPYLPNKTYELKEHEFLGIEPRDLKNLKFSNWNSFRNKLVVLQTVSFQENDDFNTLRLFRAIDNNILLSKLSKSEQDLVTERLLPFQELCDMHNEYSELLKNTAPILGKHETKFKVSNENQNNQTHMTSSEALDLRMFKKLASTSSQNRYKKPEELVFKRIGKRAVHY